MAVRRMFSRNVIETDAFYDLPYDAQALYVHLCMAADDDGFVGSPKRCCNMCGVDGATMDRLIQAGYVLPFASGVIVITDWLVSNKLRADRYTATMHRAEAEKLGITDTGRYVLNDGNQIATKWQPKRQPKRQPAGSTVQDSTGQDSLGQDSSEQDSAHARQYTAAQIWDICRTENIKLSTVQIAQFISGMNAAGWIAGGRPVQNIGAVLRKYSQEQQAQTVGGALGFND